MVHWCKKAIHKLIQPLQIDFKNVYIASTHMNERGKNMLNSHAQPLPFLYRGNQDH